MTQSEELFARAQRLIPGGVNSPVRAFKAVGGTPLFIRKAEGARMWDADGKGYIDYMGSWGPLILGHAHPSVIEAITQSAARGTSYGAPCAAEVELADRVVRLVPSIQKVRFVSSGTEATMSALRLARGFTGRTQDPEVRRLLSRPRGRPAGRGGLGGGHARHSGLAGSAGGNRRRHRHRALQRPRRGREGDRGARHRPRRHHRRARGRQHGLSSLLATAICRVCATWPAARARSSSSTRS